ncbi:hypothetical protein KY284_012771 [Solanum tuberosum]|nr:hypothetical protein KY284_012771 [Solanum tuberosum]
MPCSPTLLLSGKDSQNFEAQSVGKPVTETPIEDLEVVYQPGPVVRRDLPEGKGTKSNILAATEELVAAQSLTSLRGDIQTTFLEEECWSPEQVPHSFHPMFDQTPNTMGVNSEEQDEEVPLVWSRRGVRGENASNMCAPDFGETQDAHEVRIEEEPTELEKKRKRKGKGKMVESSNKGDNRRYVTRGTIQKLLEDALAANEAQTIRNRRQRQLHSVPTEYPISLPQEIGSNETEFEDIFKAMVKRQRNK